MFAIVNFFPLYTISHLPIQPLWSVRDGKLHNLSFKHYGPQSANVHNAHDYNFEILLLEDITLVLMISYICNGTGLSEVHVYT